MSRNQNSHFAQNPSVSIKRSRFDMSHTVKTTFDAGKLVPVDWMEVLPGDTFSVDTSILTRMQTLITPLMDDMYLDLYYFFVPNRLLWEHWQEFCGENSTPWFDNVVYTVPQIEVDVAPGSTTNNAVKTGTVADYLGMPLPAPGTFSTSYTEKFNHLPFRAYCRIWNEWFRSENLQNLTAFNMSDSDVTLDNTSSAFYGGELLPVNKYRDYFTSCLPSAQRGPSVTIGVADYAPVFTQSKDHDRETLKHGESLVQPLNWVGSNGALTSGTKYTFGGSVSTGSGRPEPSIHTAGTTTTATLGTTALAPSNLYADISAATGISINELRLAFATQRFYEQTARSGSRYVEILDSLFNVNAGDARLQRSEYLGGNRVHINVSQVTQQSETGTTPLGDLGAYSLTVDNQNSFTKSFVEHGILMCLACVRYDHSYQQGYDRKWMRKDKFDYYWPTFANIGEQPVYNKQLFVNGSATDDEVFGFQEAWAEYRYGINHITGEFRSGYAQTLDYWHLADYYSSKPNLSAAWLQEDGQTIDRVLAVSSRVSDQFMMDVYIKNTATRPMPLYSVPGLDVL